jgi:hypothetical protein
MRPVFTTNRHKIPSRRSVVVSRQADGTAIGFQLKKKENASFFSMVKNRHFWITNFNSSLTLINF